MVGWGFARPPSAAADTASRNRRENTTLHASNLGLLCSPGNEAWFYHTVTAWEPRLMKLVAHNVYKSHLGPPHRARLVTSAILDSSALCVLLIEQVNQHS